MPGVVPVPIRNERNRILRELAAQKNEAFRRNMLGREVSAVTIEPLGLALTDNYVRAQLDLPYTSNRVVRLRPRALTTQGVAADLLLEVSEVQGRPAYQA